MKCTTVIDRTRPEEVVIYLHKESAISQKIEALIADSPSELTAYSGDTVKLLRPEDVLCFISEGGQRKDRNKKKMNKYVKSFLLRGLAFAGFGPVVLGIVYFVLNYTLPDFSLDGAQVFLAILSTYILAFIQAGASVFNQIEHWPIAKSLLCHMTLLYAAYCVCYLVNSWIPFEPVVLLIFSAVFVVGYLAIWLTVYFSVKHIGNRLNENLG